MTGTPFDRLRVTGFSSGRSYTSARLSMKTVHKNRETGKAPRASRQPWKTNAPIPEV